MNEKLIFNIENSVSSLKIFHKWEFVIKIYFFKFFFWKAPFTPQNEKLESDNKCYKKQDLGIARQWQNNCESFWIHSEDT